MSARYRIAVAAGCVAVFLGLCVLLHLRGAGFGDIGVYHNYATQIVEGRMPYRDVPIEYPPGFLVPAVGAQETAKLDSQSYVHEFGLWMTGAGAALLLFAALALSALRVGRRHYATALGFIAVSPFLLGDLMLTHFDLWVTALAIGGLGTLLAGRNRSAGVLIGAAIATKLWPAVLLPLCLAWIWRRHGKGAAIRWLALVGAICAAFFLPFAALAPGGLGHSFGVQIERPLQIESLGSSILLAAHNLSGLTVSVKSSFGSINLTGTGATTITSACTVLEVIALCTIWIAFARGPARAERLATAAAASVAAFVAFDKVFSPQYLIWLIPFVPLARSRLASLLLAVALVITQFYDPAHYLALATLHPWMIWLLLGRNLLVVMLAVELGRLLLERDPAQQAASERAHPPPLADTLPALPPWIAQASAYVRDDALAAGWRRQRLGASSLDQPHKSIEGPANVTPARDQPTTLASDCQGAAPQRGTRGPLA